ncbi:TetR/AcrR family transcriptional regulator [Roseomonas sp. GC11]|uniref:TetR/AcrR family transcriptional regulator n=1 Tax=Roseomonas sp. GC11 TaxID=2950546 RepID=UPI00210A5867|nr:TetR/AcrR family transcriptional regulator [Roseomonas sp. GC11]MCQ4159371.1 TetR/AcrR family transcriptional regulator [Roseomonas sp. GC11]
MTTQAPARPAIRRNMPEAERRACLLQAARHIFLREGYAAANMADIASLAGMSKKTLYQLFSSKAELFEALVVYSLSPLRPEMDDTGLDMEQALYRRLQRIAQVLLVPEQIGLLRLVSAEGQRYPELADAFNRIGPGGSAEELERWLAAQAQAGRLEIEDARDCAHMLIGMVLGGLHIAMLLGLMDRPPLEPLEARLRQATRIFLRGARPEGMPDEKVVF